MVYVDLPPEFGAGPAPIPPTRPGREPLSPQRSYRRAKVLQQLIDPIPIGETAGLLEQQSSDIHHAFRPRNGWQDWLTDTIATILLRINRSERVERKLRDLASYHAFDFWEEDQKLAVETVASRLAREPAKVVAQLRETPTGIDWLLARWRILARVEPRAWTDGQRDLAFQLVGGDAGIDPTEPGFVAGRISDLEAFRTHVSHADSIVRGLVEADLHDDGVPGLAKLRRYVRALHRQLKWYVDQFHVEHPDRWDDPRRRPASEGPPREEWRPRNYNHFEGKVKPASVIIPPEAAPVAEVAPENDETNPPGVQPAPEIAETNPLRAASVPEIAETKPLEPAQRIASSFQIEPPVFVHDYSNEKGRHHSRPLGAGEHSHEYARLRKAARRRTNLALAELT